MPYTEGTLLSKWDSPSSLNSGQVAVCGTRGKDAVHGGNSVEHVDDSLVVQQAGGLSGTLLLTRLGNPYGSKKNQALM